MAPLDYQCVTIALEVAARWCEHEKHNKLAGDGYRAVRRRIEAEFGPMLAENAKPVAASVSERTAARQITAADVARFLGRPVSRVRDQGGAVLLAWLPGVGCRFVSRRKLAAYLAA